ncbi:MAG: amidohydrolase, partial [Deltaproteobacteria bacterium]|nr:amidohydrolase [Deltaproteobacteria bacterium]
KPVIIIHASFHFCVVNTKALKAFGIDASSKNPKGGVIRRISGTQNPNGVLEENAFFIKFFPLMEQFGEEIEDFMFERAQKTYASYGYSTAVEGRSTKAISKVLKRAADKGKITLDVLAFADIMDNKEDMQSEYHSPEYKNNYRIAGAKLVLDGSPQGKTAWLTQPYFVIPEGLAKNYKGFPIHTDEEAFALIDSCYKNGWKFQIHTNGDAAIDQFIEGVRRAVAKYGKNNIHPVLVHGQTLRADQIPELVELEIFPSLFPMHTFYWGDWHVSSVLGHPRADFISPTKSVMDAGLLFTSHHDAPVATPSIFRVLDATINRVTRTGVVLGPDQRVSPYVALQSNTIWAAVQHFEDQKKGTLTEGKHADFVILNQNPLKIDPLSIKDLYVVENIKRGKSIYKKGI